jgi:3,5-epimerase/4-reductase
MKYLIFGRDGWLAGKFKEALGDEAELSLVDITDLRALEIELTEKKPAFIINAAGCTGRPNIDWCESHLDETLASNFYGPKNIVTAIMTALPPDEWPWLVHLGSGCIFQGDADGKGWKETDIPTPESFYSKTKWMADQHLMAMYANRSLVLRLRMPIDGTTNGRNLIMKLINYKKIINDPNSITVVPDFIDAAIKLMDKHAFGIYHIVNPGITSPAAIMKEYQNIVDPDFEFEEITDSQLNTVAPRSNCVLNSEKLEGMGIKLRPIDQRLKEILTEFKVNAEKEVGV